MFSGNMYNPFDKVSIFSEDFKTLLNEMAEQMHRFAELHESIEAHLLETSEAGKAVPAGTSDVFMGKIMEVVDPGAFNTTYMIQNLAETITTLDSDPPGGCTSTIAPPRCDGIPYVIPYNRFFDGGQPAGGTVLVDFHAALVDDWVMVGKVKNEVPEGDLVCDPKVPQNLGACDLPAGGCQDLTLQGECENILLGTWRGPGTCCVLVPGNPAEPAEYAIWITEDVKISECPAGAARLPGSALPGFSQGIPTILPPPQLIGRVQ